MEAIVFSYATTIHNLSRFGDHAGLETLCLASLTARFRW